MIRKLEGGRECGINGYLRSVGYATFVGEPDPCVGGSLNTSTIEQIATSLSSASSKLPT